MKQRDSRFRRSRSSPIRAAAGRWRRRAGRRDTEERLLAALDASETGTFRWDIRTDRVEWDDNCRRLFGLEPRHTVRTLVEFLARVHEGDRAGLTEACLLCADRGGDLDQEFRVTGPEGEVRWLRTCGRTYPDGAADPVYLTGAATDVTRLKRAELARDRLLARERRARTEAERAIRGREEVLAVVAHDLRNPLSTILMTASLVDEMLSSGRDPDHYLALIRRAATEMDALVRDLLDISRIEGRRFSVSREPLDLADLLRGCVDLVEPQALPRGIALTLHVPAHLPRVSGDPARLRQAVSNLLGNALRFTPDGGRIALHAVRHHDDAVRVSIRDTGPGIDAADLPHVFDRFWRHEAPSRPGGSTGSGPGAGLGLAIVRGIIRAHGGEIWVRSTPGDGTTFHFTLPRGVE